MEKLIELEAVTVSYNNKAVLSDVNLVINREDFVGVIGPNGGGKTTLLKIILGLLKPQKGTVKFNQKHLNIGYLPQFNIQDKDFPITVQDLVLSGLSSKKNMFKKNSEQDIERSEQLMKSIGIIDYRDKSIQKLSGGQVQRAFLCRALISNPELLILDEPTTFIDKSFQGNLYEILKKLNKNMAIILVSHELTIIPSYVKSLVCVNNTASYHNDNKITEEMLEQYECPIEMITHGKIPHRVLNEHGGIWNG